MAQCRALRVKSWKSTRPGLVGKTRPGGQGPGGWSTAGRTVKEYTVESEQNTADPHPGTPFIDEKEEGTDRRGIKNKCQNSLR